MAPPDRAYVTFKYRFEACVAEGPAYHNRRGQAYKTFRKYLSLSDYDAVVEGESFACSFCMAIG